LAPSAGKVGTIVQLYINGGADYVDGDYQVLWSDNGSFIAGQTLTLAQGSVPSGSHSITVAFTIPESKLGYHYVRFLRIPMGQTFDTSFAVKAGLKVAPLQAAPGAVVTLTGSGFPSNDFGKIVFNKSATDVSYNTNAVGSFSAQFTIPAGTDPGEYVFGTVSSRYSDESAAHLIVLASTGSSVPNPEPTTPAVPNPQPTTPSVITPVTPPSAPTKITPRPYAFTAKCQELGQFGSKEYTLTWQELSGLSNLTSTVEISKDPNFIANPDITISGITGTSLTVILEPGTYYWRVKTLSSDGTSSDWNIWGVTSSNHYPWPIEVDFITAWFYAIAGAFLVVIFLFLIVVLVSSRRKPKEIEYYPYYGDDRRYYR